VPQADGAELRCAYVSADGRLMRCAATLLLVITTALTACVTPQMHTEAQLNEVATGCGLALGELIQDESEKKLVLLIHQDPSAEQRVCVARWARRNGLKTVFVNMQFPEG
jgi:hypothetical protein